MNFADIIIPVSLPNLFTYFIPEELEESIFIGCRVIVPFGKNKLYTGIVKKIHHLPPKEYQAKGIEHVLDNHPIVLQNQLKLWDWIADYYMANIGDVMQMALPSGFKLVSETKILLSDNIVNFDELKKIDGVNYVKFFIKSPIEMKFNDIEMSADKRAQMINNFEAKFGKGNVVFDEVSGFFKINADKVIIASSDEKLVDWKFLTIDNPRMKMMLEKVIPSELLN